MIYNRSLEDDYLNFKKDTDDLIPFLLGRNAINYLIKSHGIRAILLPTYICSMVVDIFKYYKIEVYFYENLNKQLEVPLLSILERVKDVRTEKKLFFLWHDYLNIIGDMPDELYNFLEKSNIEVIIDATHTLPLKNYKSKNKKIVQMPKTKNTRPISFSMSQKIPNPISGSFISRDFDLISSFLKELSF